MSGLVQFGRSASRPLPHLTTAGGGSAAPPRAPGARPPPPGVVVTKAGSTGYTISLAKSLHNETAESPLTGPGSGPSRGSVIQPHPPAHQGHRNAAVAQELAVELRLVETAPPRGAH